MPESTASKPTRGLLGAVLSNPKLRQQLSRMPADEKTIAVTSKDGADFSHPDWKAGNVDSAIFETMELANPNDEDGASIDDGFVPKRGIANVGDALQDAVDYRIVGRLGAGGTAVVYQAHQRAVDREVAVKVLRDDLAYHALSRQRFLTEARVIGGLDHPNVIAIHEVCLDESGGLFYSMKRIDGTSWDQRIDEMTETENIDTLLRVCNAIRYAHSRGLIHRDIKPENVMLGRFGEVLLADWGLALSYKRSDDADNQFTELDDMTSSIGGTPAYMAPELAMGNQYQTCFQTDVYLLGASLFQVLTGKAPHQGKSLLACIHAAAHNEIVETDVTGELMSIAMKALSTRPEDRYQTVEEFIDAIESQRQHQQSVRLVRRAQERLKALSGANRYEDFRVADALLIEAIDIWPENERALEARRQLQLRFAETATTRGDLDLAWSIYEAAGEAESEAAMNVRRTIQERDASEERSTRFLALFDHSPQAGLLIAMENGKVIEANHMFNKLFGYSNDQLLGRPIAELNLWACPQKRDELVEQLRGSGAIDEFEAKLLHLDRSEIIVLLSARVVEVQDEEFVVATFQDISIRKKAECDLKKSRQRLCDLQRLAGIGTWSYDVATDEVTWSEEVYEILGRDKGQHLPSRDEFYSNVHPDDREKLYQAVSKAKETGESYEQVVRFSMPDGSLRTLLVRGKPILDEDGQTTEVYGVVLPQQL